MDMNEINEENKPVQETVETIELTEAEQPVSDISAKTVTESDPLLEISVLDYLKFKLNPKNFGKEILPADHLQAENGDDSGEDSPTKVVPSLGEKLLSGGALVKTKLNPLFLAISLCLALSAQIVLEPTIIPRTRVTPWIGSGLYLLSALCFFFSFVISKNKAHEDSPEASAHPLFDAQVRYEFLGLSAICAVLAFLLFGGNQFTFLNVSVWILSILFAALAFSGTHIREIPARVRNWFSSAKDRKFIGVFRFSAWNFLWLAVFLLCAFFLFHDLNAVPVDMVSDHAEKLYDIKDILDGKRPIFFTRNTGRECFQFYFTVLVIKLFGTGLSFLSLKIGTALAGLFILPFVYKLGKMLGNRWIGLLAMLFCGISYWPIVIQRAACALLITRCLQHRRFISW